MKRVVVAALAFAVFAGGARAAGYDDFAAGMTADLRGEHERAIMALTAALAAPDLVRSYRAVALRVRAHSYLLLKKCQEAAADLKAYEALKQPDDQVVAYKIWADFCLKDVAAARRDLAIVPKGKLDPDLMFEASRLAWRFGHFDEAMHLAREAFVGTGKEEPRAAYMLIWQALSAMRAGHFDAAEITSSLATLTIRLDGWPKPILALFVGKLSPQELQKQAESWADSTDTGQRCEANFYTAEWYLARDDKASAIPLLTLAVQKCSIRYDEYQAAKDELKRLGEPVSKE